MSTTWLIHSVVVLGIAAVLPLALGGPLRWWVIAAGYALLAFLVPVGLGSAVLVGPFVAVVAWRAVVRERRPRRRWLDVVPDLYALVAAGALVQSRLGAQLFGFREPIVELTTVHFIYAGAAGLTLALAAGADVAAAAGGWRRLVGVAVVCTAAAPPVLAAGFVLESAIGQVGGAIVMSTGVCLTGALHLRAALSATAGSAAAMLLGLSGLAVWVPMVLAVSWAAGQHWGVPALSIPDMARLHGLANALGFSLAGLLGRRLLEAPPLADLGGCAHCIRSLFRPVRKRGV